MIFLKVEMRATIEFITNDIFSSHSLWNPPPHYKQECIQRMIQGNGAMELL